MLYSTVTVLSTVELDAYARIGEVDTHTRVEWLGTSNFASTLQWLEVSVSGS